MFNSIEQQAFDSLSDDELQEELDGLADVIKEPIEIANWVIGKYMRTYQ